ECKEYGIIKINPTVRIKWPPLDELMPKPLDEEILFKLKEAAKGSPRDRSLIETLHCTGVRVSELINIRQDDIWWDTREIWIRKGKGLKERNVIFTLFCKELLQKYLKSRNDNFPYLFATKSKNGLRKFTRQEIWEIIKIYCEEAGINPDGISPHSLRHSFATEMKEKGAELVFLADLLGHADANNVKLYTKVTSQRMRSEYDKYH
ncbi:tyrosine-type recombinase/integrase, partial [Dethiobacter alkaliphilus]|uniref:tyrosine-type recombinase/integrase n=1 Tax=Dethiobacter alkaliphilus TaxID=427926 RepID=UPI002226245C